VTLLHSYNTKPTLAAKGEIRLSGHDDKPCGTVVAFHVNGVWLWNKPSAADNGMIVSACPNQKCAGVAHAVALLVVQAMNDCCMARTRSAAHRYAGLPHAPTHTHHGHTIAIVAHIVALPPNCRSVSSTSCNALNASAVNN